MAALSACGSSAAADGKMIEDYADVEVAVSGLAEAEFTITPRQLCAMPLTTVKAGGADAAGVGRSAKATGVTLAEFLRQYGYAVEDIAKLRAVAGDGYVISLTKTLRERDVYLTVGYDGQPLLETERPLRLVIPETETGSWIYNITRMEFSLAESD